MTRFPKSAKSKSIIAELIARKFSFRCEKQDVHHWQNLSRIPVEGCNIPFPAPSKNNLYVVDDCFAWVEKWVLPHRNGNDAAARVAQMEAKERIDEHKAELLGLQLDVKKGRLIDRGIAERTAISTIKKLLGFYKSTDENLIPQECSAKLESIGVTAEQKKEFIDWFVPRMQSVTDQREAKTEAAIEEMSV